MLGVKAKTSRRAPRLHVTVDRRVVTAVLLGSRLWRADVWCSTRDRNAVRTRRNDHRRHDTGETMNATLAPNATTREQYRGTAKSLRSNAGITSDDQVVAVADFGAAARRLRESVRAGDDATSVRRHVSAQRRALSAPVHADPIMVDAIVVITGAERVDAASPTRSRESVVLRMVRKRTRR